MAPKDERRTPRSAQGERRTPRSTFVAAENERRGAPRRCGFGCAPHHRKIVQKDLNTAAAIECLFLSPRILLLTLLLLVFITRISHVSLRVVAVFLVG